MNLGFGLVPSRVGVDSTWVSPLGLTFDYLCQFLFLNSHMFFRMISGMLTAPREGVTLPDDAVRREANHVSNEHPQTRGPRRWAWSAAQGAAKAQEEDTPSKPESSGRDDEEEGEVTPPPHYPLPENLPSFCNLFNWQVGISVGARQSKWRRTGIRLLIGPSQ
jgi:hypothetical protein